MPDEQPTDCSGDDDGEQGRLERAVEFVLDVAELAFGLF
jgi:hypothetical protein